MQKTDQREGAQANADTWVSGGPGPTEGKGVIGTGGVAERTSITGEVMEGLREEAGRHHGFDDDIRGVGATGGVISGEMSGPTGGMGYTGGVGMPNKALEGPFHGVEDTADGELTGAPPNQPKTGEQPPENANPAEQ